MFAAAGMRCTVHHRRRPCGGTAIGQCMACQMPVCFEHSMISPKDGTVICFGCVGEMVRQQRGAVPPRAEPSDSPPPPQDEPAWWGVPPGASSEDQELRLQYLSVLGLDDSASYETIRVAYRRLAAQCHPDRVRGEQARRAAEQRLKQINEAYSWLNQHREAA